ncbi:MAG: energy transducer TonB [Candidatus Acidiferrum sp.]
MQFPAHLLAVCVVGGLAAASFVEAQGEIANPQAIVSAKTIYFEDKSGVDEVGKKASAELNKWGRFQIVQDRKKADLVVVLSTDPQRGGNLILSGGQTGTIDSRGHIEEDSVPNYNKLAPVRYAFLTVIDARTGDNLWSASQRWGGLLTGFDSAGERLVKEFEKQTQAAERRSSLKVVKSVNPTFPKEASGKQIEGTVTVRIVVDKNGKVAEAKALNGPPELSRSAVEAAKQYQFAPPQNAPVTTQLEMTYGLAPKPCPPGKKGDRAEVSYAERLPMKTEHVGTLKVVGDIDVPLPPYPVEAREGGIEGDLELFITVAPNGEVVGALVIKSVDPAIDEAALATVRTWKFKVTRGEQAGFPIKFLYRMTCDSPTDK